MRSAWTSVAWLITAAAVAMLASATTAVAVTVNIGSAKGVPGESVAFQVSLASEGAQVGGVQHTIAFDHATPISSCVIHPLLTGLSGWSLQPQGCTPLVNCTQANFVILLFGTAIPDGLLYQCQVKIAADAPGGLFPLRCLESRAGEPGGQPLTAQCVEGHIEVVRPTPTGTATPGSITTATPTPTPVVSACSGDCDGNHLVTVEEILTMVNVALGDGAAGACGSGDGNLDGKITVDEIVAAVSAAMNGCGGG